MRPLPVPYDAARIESESREFWKSRSIPPSTGILGPAAGPRTHLLVGAVQASEGIDAFLARSLHADALARYAALGGRRAGGPLFSRLASDDPLAAEANEALARLGAGGNAPLRGIAVDLPKLQTFVDRMAQRELLRSLEVPMRACATCRIARPPATVVYSDEEGPSYVVRFPLPGSEPRASLLVWTDSVWKLLGATSVLLDPNAPYVRARFRRRGHEEEVILHHAAVERLAQWLEGSDVEVLEQQPGSAWVGRRYDHPLATEFPTLGELPAPAGVVNGSPSVDGASTGIVALVPAHGATDRVVAESLGIHGWPVLDLDGQLTRSLQHKYAGLPTATAEAFILRDLADAGLLFAELRTRRGVPRCAVCGTVLHWQVARAWCLVPSRLSTASLDAFRRACPEFAVPPADSPIPWPASEWGSTTDPTAPLLQECSRCGTVAPATEGGACRCGGTRAPIRRRLLPGMLVSLARADGGGPFASRAPITLIEAARGAPPTALQQLVALESASVSLGELRLLRIPPFPHALTSEGPADADRVAVLGCSVPPRGGAEGLAGRQEQATRRLSRVWQLAHELSARMAADRADVDLAPVGARLAEFAVEERALLSVFERRRQEILAAFDRADLARAEQMLVGLLEGELRDGFRLILQPRLASAGPASSRSASYRVAVHLLTTWAELFAPFAPHTMEAIVRAFRGDSESLFERPFTPLQVAALDENLESSYRRWRGFAGAIRGYRHELGVPANQEIPSVVVDVTDEAIAAELRGAAGVLERVGRVSHVEVSSPAHPWAGDRIEAHPVVEEIQRAYGAQGGRVVRILQGMNARRIQDGIRAGTLQVALEGRPLPVLASMVEFTEALPAGIVPIPWELGSLFVQVPPAPEGAGAPHAPSLSPDGFRVLHALRRRISKSKTPSSIERVVVVAEGPLQEELRRHSATIGLYLGEIAVEVRTDRAGVVAGETSEGRGGRGARWSLWIPGDPLSPRPLKIRRSSERLPRVRITGVPGELPSGPDYLDEQLRAREATIRESVESFDRELGRPLIGPAKLSAAWDAGFTTFDDLRGASFEELEPIPGFGPFVAGTIVQHFGGEVPARKRRWAPVAESPPSPPSAPVAPPPPVVPPPTSAPVRSVPTPAPAPVIPIVRPPPAPPPPRALPTTPTLRAQPLTSSPVPVVAAAVPPGPAPGIELWPGETADRTWQAFLEATATGHRGVCISREFPDRLRAYLGTRDVEVVWLSNIGREGSIRPGDLAALTDLFHRALSERSVAAIYLDGIEYLVRIHTLDRTIEFLRALDAEAKERDARVWIPINRALLDPASGERLAAEFPARSGG